jgi:hypothetical protein
MSEERLTPEKAAELMALVPHMKPDQKRLALDKLRIFKKNWVREHGKDSFLDFIMHVYPGYMIGDHHRRLATLMTHTLNKMLNLDDLTFLSLLGSGFSLALFNVLCLVVR